MSKRRKNQIAKLDKLWSKAVVDRDKGVCQKCGEPGDNPHHVILRRYMAVRHDLLNGVTLCVDHHVPYAHNQSLAFMEWFKEKFPDRWDVIQYLKHEIKPDLDEVEKRLKEGR